MKFLYISIGLSDIVHIIVHIHIAMKGGVCLFELISNINSVSQKSLTAPLSAIILKLFRN